VTAPHVVHTWPLGWTVDSIGGDALGTVETVLYEFHVYAVMMQRVRIRMSALNWACRTSFTHSRWQVR